MKDKYEGMQILNEIDRKEKRIEDLYNEIVQLKNEIIELEWDLQES